MDLLRPFRRGRRSATPHRDTDVFPRMQQMGIRPAMSLRPAYKPIPRNIRYFSRTPYARRAINAIKNSIAQLDWEIVARPGSEISDELLRQIEVVYNSFMNPNNDDTFATLIEQVCEDMMCGAGAIELQIGGDATKPLWLWPVDGLSINIYPGWAGGESEARYAQVLGYGMASGSTTVCDLRNDELIYIRPNPTTDNPFGLGPLEVAFQSVARLLGIASFAGDLSSNASPPTMIWMGDTSPDELNAFRSYWKNDVEGQGRMPISGGGDKTPVALALHPEGDNALYLKYQEFLKREVAISFDLSPQNLGVERDINRNTAEVAEDRDIAQAIAPWGRKIASTFTREAIQSRLGFSQIEFRFKGLDREDELEQANVFEKEYRNNAVTPNEYRVRRGHPVMVSPWGNLTYADFMIAQQAARGAKVIDDASAPNYDDANQPKGVVQETKSDRADSSIVTRPKEVAPKSKTPFAAAAAEDLDEQRSRKNFRDAVLAMLLDIRVSVGRQLLVAHLTTDPDEALAVADAVADALDLSSFATHVAALKPYFVQARVDAAVQVLRSYGLTDPDLLKEVYADAEAAAEKRVTDLLTSGADENIVDTSRRMIRSVIRRSIETATPVLSLLTDAYVFSVDRADLIAYYEKRSSTNDGKLEAADLLGPEYGKRWRTKKDGIVETICEANEAQGAIPLDQPFQSGDMAPLAHPECRCDLEIVKLEQEN